MTSRRRALRVALLAFGLTALAPSAGAWAAPGCTMRRAAAGGDALAYRECGRGDPVLLVPGGPGLDAEYMDGLARMVAALGHRAILLELRGTGASRAALGDGGGLTVAGSVADVEDVRRSVGAGRVAVLGHSFGGAIAQAYAAAYPGHVARLVLLDSVGPDFRAPALGLDSWRTRLSPDAVAAYDGFRSKGERIPAMRLKFRASFFDAARGARFAAGLCDTAIHLDVMSLAQAYQRDFAITAGKKPFAVEILAGDIDWIRGYEPALAATYPGATLRTIRHAGHFPWIDAPAATRAVLAASLR